MLGLLLILLIFCFRIRSVSVTGSSSYTEEEVTEMVFPGFFDRLTPVALFRERFVRHQTLPFIQNYDVEFDGPFRASVIVYEKNVVGAVNYMSSYMYFDMDGIVVENSPKKLMDVPEIRGLRFRNIILGKPLPVENKTVFSEILNITQQLEFYGIPCGRIDLDPLGNASVFIENGDVEVLLGTDTGISAKISALADMLPSIRERGLKGTLDLSDYDDSRKGNVSSFRKRED